MKKAIAIMTTIIILTTFIGCSSSKTEDIEPTQKVITAYSFEGSWECKEDDLFIYGALIEGNKVKMGFKLDENDYYESPFFPTVFEIVEENGVFYLYQNGKIKGDIQYIDENTIKVKGTVGPGTYKAVNALKIK